MISEDCWNAIVEQLVQWSIKEDFLIKNAKGLPSIPPIALKPTSVPRIAFLELQQIQPLLTQFIHNLSVMEESWLDSVVSTIKDPFLDGYLRIWRMSRGLNRKRFRMSVIRSDYFLEEDTRAKDAFPFKMVEVNTTSVSLARLGGYLRWRMEDIVKTYNHDPETFILKGADPHQSMIQCMRKAHQLHQNYYPFKGKVDCVQCDKCNPYTIETSKKHVDSSYDIYKCKDESFNSEFVIDQTPQAYVIDNTSNSFNQPNKDQSIVFCKCLAQSKTVSSIAIMTVSPDERNCYDQLGFGWEEIGSMYRMTLAEIDERCTVDLTNGQYHLLLDQKIPISIVYHRTGYDETQVQSGSQWNALCKIEMSNCISIPDAGTFLSGLKRVQQAFTADRRSSTSIISKILPSSQFDLQLIDRLKESLVQCRLLVKAQLEDGIERQAIEEAISFPDRFVLKSQGEGGGAGNNLWGEEMKDFLKRHQSLNSDANRMLNGFEEDCKKVLVDGEDRSTLSKYILMDLIEAKVEKMPLMPSFEISKAPKMVQQMEECVSEIGLYNFILTKHEGRINSIQSSSFDQGQCDAGYLVRSKKKEVKEGGICSLTGGGHLNLINLTL